MIDTTEVTCREYRIGDLLIIELPTMAYSRTWTIHRDLDIITIQLGLPEQERRRALAEALSEMVSPTS